MQRKLTSCWCTTGSSRVHVDVDPGVAPQRDRLTQVVTDCESLTIFRGLYNIIAMI
jgi:hypothetical protein